MSRTKEGHIWTAQIGSKTGMETIGAIIPPQSYPHGHSEVFDAIVIGAGYAGLVATRDLTIQGELRLLSFLITLLIRDRSFYSAH